MKKLITLFVCMVTLFACNNKDNGNFTVTGKITGAPSDSIYLEELPYSNAQPKVLDSAKLGADGSYTLKGNATQQNLYVLSVNNNPSVILINDANNININCNFSSFHYPDIKGSDATKELYGFIKNYWNKDSMLSITYYQLDSLNKTQSQDTQTIRQLQLEYEKQLNEMDDVIRNYVNSSKNPACICFALDKAKGAIAPDELTALAENAAKRFPAHNGLAIFKSSLAQSNANSASATYALLNQQAPNLTMKDVNGEDVSISDFKGKYLLVDFWASWCGPCRQENPNVVAAYNQFKNKNFQILGVSLDENKDDWMKAIKNDHLSWPQMSDLKQWESAAVSTYQFDGIPFNVLIDPNGKIIASSLRDQALQQKLSEVLK